MCSSGGSEPWQPLQAAAEVLAAEDVTSWSDDQVHDALRVLLPLMNQLTAVLSTVAGSFDLRDLAERDGFRAARSWLIAFGRMSQGVATGWLSRGRLLRKLPALSAAAHTGAVSAEQVRTIGDLAAHVGIETVAPFDEILAGLGRHQGPAEVAQACHRIRAHVDPDGADPDPDAGERRALSIARCGSLFSVSGRLDLEGGATLLTALDAMMQPPTPDDPRTAVQRRADAMVELARQALQGGTLPTVGGVRPQLGLLITPETLLGLRHATATPTTAPADPADTCWFGSRRRAALPLRTRHRHDSPMRWSALGYRWRRNCPGPTGPTGCPPPWLNASPATVRSGEWSWIRRPDCRWRSAGRTGSCRTGCARHSSPETVAADGPDVPHRQVGARCTTYAPGTTPAD